MKNNLLNLLVLFFLYAFFLLLEQPIKSLLYSLNLTELKVASIGTILKHLPLMVFFIWLLKKWNFEKFNGIKKGVTPENKRLLWIPTVYLLFVVFSNFNAFKYLELTDLLLYSAGLLMIGLTEEIFFRGILFPSFIESFKNQRYPLFIGVIFSSVLFGLVHYINLFFDASFTETSIQVIGGFSMGIFLCGLLLKTKSIIIPALIHSIWNLNETIGFFRFIQMQQVSQMDSLEATGNVPQMIFSEILINELPTILLLLSVGAFLVYKANFGDRYSIATRE